MTLKAFTVVIDCTDPRRQADFWAEVLSCDVRERNPDEYLVSDPACKAFPLYFMKVPEPKVGKNRFHLDLVTDGSMSEEVDRLVKLGARLVDVRQDDAETYDKSRHVDSVRGLGGNVFCVTSSTTFRDGHKRAFRERTQHPETRPPRPPRPNLPTGGRPPRQLTRA